MSKLIGRNKELWLRKQGCIFINVVICGGVSTVIKTKHGEYVGLADLGENENSINFIYKHRLTQLSCIDRAKTGKLSETGCNSVSIGFSEKEQAWYGWTHRGFGKFYIGYEVKQGSIMDCADHKYPFKVETLEQAKMLAIEIADYLD